MSEVARRLLANTGWQVSFSVAPWSAAFLAELLPALLEDLPIDIAVDTKAGVITLWRRDKGGDRGMA